MDGGGKRWFDLFFVVITLICLVALAFIFFAGPAEASASLVSWDDSHDPADFSPVVSDSSGSLPGSESREAESLAGPGAIDQLQEEEDQEQGREAESLAEPGAIDQLQEEEDQEQGREAESLAEPGAIDQLQEEEDQEEGVQQQGRVLADFAALEENEDIVQNNSSDELGDIALDVSAIRGLLEVSSSGSLETQEEQISDEDSVDNSSDVSADASAVSSDTSVSDEEQEDQEEPATLDTIHQDLSVLLFTLWGFAGLFLAFKVGGAVLGRL